jgi:hypothetical protein
LITHIDDSGPLKLNLQLTVNGTCKVLDCTSGRACRLDLQAQNLSGLGTDIYFVSTGGAVPSGDPGDWNVEADAYLPDEGTLAISTFAACATLKTVALAGTWPVTPPPSAPRIAFSCTTCIGGER